MIAKYTPQTCAGANFSRAPMLQPRIHRGRTVINRSEETEAWRFQLASRTTGRHHRVDCEPKGLGLLQRKVRISEAAALKRPVGRASMASLFVRSLMTGAVLILASAPSTTRIASAQPYCAAYDNGSRSCGIPTLQSCQQSVDGVGGICQPDYTAQQRPDFFSGRRLRQAIEGDNPASSENNPPGGPDLMPPPPDQ